MIDAWTWSLQYLQLMNAVNLRPIVPPCPELPRFVHLRVDESDRSWSDEAKARHSTRMKNRGTTVENNGRTALKYLESILALKAEHPDWTQKQLGDAVGIAQGAVSRLLKDVQ